MKCSIIKWPLTAINIKRRVATITQTLMQIFAQF